MGLEREGGGRRGTEIRAGERKEEEGGEGAVCVGEGQGLGRVGTWRTGRGLGWAGPRPASLWLKLAGARPKDSEAVGSHPTQKVIATASEAEICPLWLCALGNWT